MNFSPIKRNREVLINTKPAFRYDSSLDFAEWQKSAREKLFELLGLSEIEPCDSCFKLDSTNDCGKFTEYVFTIQSEKNYYITSTLRVNKGVKGSAPLAICLFGHTEDISAALDGDNDRDLVNQALSRGYAALSLEQRSFDNCFATKDETLEEASRRVTWCACYRSSMRAAMLGRTTMGERVWDIMRAIDVCAGNFDFLDMNNIVVVGQNGSATAALYAGAIDERITAVISSCGFGTWESSLASFNHCTCNYIPNITPYFDMGDIAGLVAPRKLVLLATTADTWYPERGVREAYAFVEAAYAASADKCACKLIVNEGERRFYAEDAWSNL